MYSRPASEGGFARLMRIEAARVSRPLFFSIRIQFQYWWR